MQTDTPPAAVLNQFQIALGKVVSLGTTLRTSGASAGVADEVDQVFKALSDANDSYRRSIGIRSPKPQGTSSEDLISSMIGLDASDKDTEGPPKRSTRRRTKGSPSDNELTDEQVDNDDE